MPKFKILMISTLLITPTLTMASSGEVEILIKNHRFEPAEVTIPANTKMKLKVVNTDPTPEEFESHSLNREKVIPGNSSAVIFVGPLEAGEYKFVGEFNEDTAQGKLIVQ